jgi:hypothetical protein
MSMVPVLLLLPQSLRQRAVAVGSGSFPPHPRANRRQLPVITAHALRGLATARKVLRPSRPGDKYLAGPLETTAASEELCKRCRRQPAHRHESKEGQNRLALPHLHLRNLAHEACVPTKRRPLVLRRVTISEEQGELECFNESDDLDLRSRGERFGDIPTIERSAESDGKPNPAWSRTNVRTPSVLETAHVILMTGCNQWDSGLDIVVEGEAVEVTDEELLERLADEWGTKWDGRWHYGRLPS